MRPILVLVALLLVAFLPSCATHSAAKPAFHPAARQLPINELSLLLMPVPVNLNTQHGADGFAATVYASSPESPKTVPIHAGTLQILMYDGLLQSGASQPPLQTWSFPASELPRYSLSTSIGTSYQFALSWGTNQPTQNRITILARYLPLSGPPVTAAPTPLAITVH